MYLCTDSFAFLLVRKKIEMFLQEERRGGKPYIVGEYT